MIRRQAETGMLKKPARHRFSRGKARRKINGVIIGRLVAMDDARVPRVEYSRSPVGSLPARTTVILTLEQIGRDVALMFEDGDPGRPVILGVLQGSQTPASPTTPLQASVDGETVTLTAENQIVLRCGKASITLSRDGKVQIRGAYLLSRSSGVNRIQGGSIELN